MKNRIYRVHFRMEEKDYKLLKKQLSISGLSLADYMSRLVRNKKIKERPPKEYAQMVYELAKLGNNVNQLAHKANATNYAAVESAERAVLLMEKCYDIVKDLE